MKGVGSIATLASLSLMVGLSACGNFLGKNVSFLSDSVRKAQADDVVVESGSGGMSATESSAALLAGQSPRVGEHSGSDGAVGRTVTVQKGDTLSAIARRNSVSVAALKESNGLDDKATIRIGQKLFLPSGHSAAVARTSVASSPMNSVTKKDREANSRVTSYKVKEGETLGGIAARHHTTVSALLKANGMTKEQADRVRAGQSLRIPAGR